MIGKDNATMYIGCVGKDEYGSRLRKCMEGDKVAAEYYEIDSKPTGTCAVLLVDKERSMVANLSAANEYSIDHLNNSNVSSKWQSAQNYFVEGYFFTVATPSILQVAKHASSANKAFALSLSAPFICQFFTEQLMSVMPYIDILFGNESEAEAIAQKLGFKESTPSAAAAGLSLLEKANTKRERIVIITCGADAVVVARNGKVDLYDVPKMDSKTIVDTNGAGDAFAGGFMSQFVQGADISYAVTCGNYSAQEILKVSGTKLSGKPTLPKA
jgi:adenosine kinase